MPWNLEHYEKLIEGALTFAGKINRLAMVWQSGGGDGGSAVARRATPFMCLIW